MTSYEEREALRQLGNGLLVELRKITQQVHSVINRLDSEADRLIPAACDEVEQKTTVTKIKHNAVTKPEEPEYIENRGSRGPEFLPNPAYKKKRQCSLCRGKHQPPHRAQNCPDADAAYKAQRKGGGVSKDHKK